jgi:hypothetical protein
MHVVLYDAGDFPWVEGAVNANVSSAHRHYAQRYRHALAQHSRSTEEREMLRAEVILLFNGLEEREASIAQAQQRAASSSRSTSGGVGGGSGLPGASKEMGAASASSGVPGGGGNGEPARLSDNESNASAGLPGLLVAGELKLLEIELSRLQLIHAEATRLLKVYL